MLNEASMWTYIEVPRINPDPDSKIEGLFHILDMQISRTADLPLDVVFFLPERQVIHNRIIGIFLEYETFSRWRSLVLRMDYVGYLEKPKDILAFVSESFSSLESLTVVYRSYSHTIKILRGTVAERSSSLPRLTLDTFDIYPDALGPLVTPPVDTAMINRIYGVKLEQLSSLVLPNLSGSINEDNFLPEHITEIECGWRRCHPFPYVQDYILGTCLFMKESPPSLDSLVSLTTSELQLQNECRITLNSLQRISCTSIELKPGSAFLAPALQQLHIREPPDHHFPRPPSHATAEAFASEGFGLIPSQVLLLDDFFNAETVLPLLRRCSHVPSVSLTFMRDTEAQKVLESLAAGNGLEQGPVVDVFGVERAPCFSFEFKIRLLNSQSSVNRCNSHAVDLVDKRKESGVALKIYGKLEDDSEYTLLA